MQDVPNEGHWLGMSNFFQWITLLQIENIYFVGTRVKDPYTLAQISLFINPSDLWVARPKFNFNGPLGGTSKFKSIEPLGSMSKLQFHRTFGNHVQNFKSIGSLGSMSKIQDHDWNPHFAMTTGKHVLYSFFFLWKKRVACMNYVWTWSSHQEVRRQSPLRFGPHFDPLHDGLHSYLHASYIHHS